MKLRRVSLVLVALALAVGGSALAGKKKKTTTTTTTTAGATAWDTAKGILPSSYDLVAGVDVKSLLATKTAQKALDKVLAEEADAKEGVDTLKTMCGIDATKVVKDVVVAGTMASNGDDMVFFIGLDGVDEAKVTDCLTQFAKSEKKTLNSSKSGNVIEYSISGETDKLYIAWPASNVLAITSDPMSKTKLTTALGGKGASGDIATWLGNIKTSATAWMVIKQSSALDTGMNMTGLYGTLDATGGNIAGEIHVVLDSKDGATTAAKTFGDQLKQLQKDKTMDAKVKKVLKTVKISSKDAEIIVTGKVAESDLVDLAKDFGGSF